MLKMIRKQIEDMKNSEVSFEEYYKQYIIDTQDRNMLQEIKYITKIGSVNPLMIDRAINSCIEEMKNLW